MPHPPPVTGIIPSKATALGDLVNDNTPAQAQSPVVSHPGQNQ